MPAGDRVLARLEIGGDEAGIASRLRAAVPGIALWRSTEGQLLYAYADTSERSALLAVLPADADLSTLVCTLRIPGPSAGFEAPWHYVVETDVEPHAEADFNAWYDCEHVPGLASVPGTVLACRYERMPSDGGVALSQRYHACYDLAKLEAFGSPEWMAVRGTEWSSRVRPSFRNTRRTMFRRI